MNIENTHRFVSHARVRDVCLPFATRVALEASGAPVPAGFTGCWKGQHYFKGVKWEGPTNTMGARRR